MNNTYPMAIGIILLLAMTGCITNYNELDDVVPFANGNAGNVPTLNADKNQLIWGDANAIAVIDQNKTKTNSTDTNSGYLDSEIIAGSNITLTQTDSGGGDYKLSIASTGGGSATDENASCTVTVGISGADYTDIPTAVDAIKTSGGRVCVSAGTFQLTRPIDINGANIEIIGVGLATTIRTNPISIPTAIRLPGASQLSNIRLKNFQISASSSLGNGTAIDGSKMAIGHISDIYINGYNHGIDFNNASTFYNEIDNVRISVNGNGSTGIKFAGGANDNTVFRTRILADGNTIGITINGSHGNSLYEVNVESLAYIGIDINTGANDTTVYSPYLESNNINLSLASGVYGFALFGGSIQSGTTANIQDLGADKPVMTGMKLGFASAPSIFGDINGVGDINTSKNINTLGDINSNDAMKAQHYDTTNRSQDYVLQVFADMWAFCVFGSSPCSGLKFVNTGRKGFDFTINGVSVVHFGASNGQGVIFLPPRIVDPTSGSGDKNSGAMYVKSTDLNRLVINTGTFASPNFTEVGADILGNWHVQGTATMDSNVHGQLLGIGSLVTVTCNTVCGGISYSGPWTCVEADNVTGAASTCGDVTVAHNCICKN